VGAPTIFRSPSAARRAVPARGRRGVASANVFAGRCAGVRGTGGRVQRNGRRDAPVLAYTCGLPAQVGRSRADPPINISRSPVSVANTFRQRPHYLKRPKTFSNVIRQFIFKNL